MSTKRLGFLIAIISAVMYGLNPLLAKTVYASGANAFTVVFLRMAVGSVVFLLMHKLTSKETIGISKQELGKLLLCSLGYGFTPVLLYTSYQYLASGLASTIHFVYPAFIVLGSAMIKLEKLTKKKALCCLLCMLGIVCFYTPGGEISIPGIIIAFLSGVVYAYYAVYLAASGLLEMAPYKLSFWKHLFSMVIVGVVALVSGQFAWPQTAQGYLFVIMLGIVTAAASFLYQQATKLAGAQDTAMLSTFEPLTCVILGVAVYQEQLTVKSIAGIVFILLSVILISLEGKTANRDVPS